MNHRLVVRYLTQLNDNPSITTEFAVNGSLRNHLSESQYVHQLEHPTKIAKIIAGIALAMRYIYSKGVIHRNLTPDNILLDWDWNVRIADFGCSTFNDKSRILSLRNANGSLRNDAYYCAPECYANIDDPAIDVFVFGLILSELVVGKPAFPKSMKANEVAGAVVLRDWRPDIPNSVFPDTAELIQDCWAPNYRERLCFEGILERLEQMQFKLIRRVNSSKLTTFVKEIQEWESNHHSQ
jgi:serine/threonine protein kinase